MKKNLALFILLCTSQILASTAELGQEYIERWKKFYPSEALAMGIHSAIFDYEDRSAENIESWLAFNKKMFQQLSTTTRPKNEENSIDIRLLNIQLKTEIDKWEQEAPHQHSLSLYATLIANAIAQLEKATFLTHSEKKQLALQRLAAVQNLCSAAIRVLEDGDRDDLENGLKRLAQTADFYRAGWQDLAGKWGIPATDKTFSEGGLATSRSIQALISHVTTAILPKAKASNFILGREEYARKLTLYTDSPLTPEQLAEMALTEIEQVRKLIGEISLEYLKTAYPIRTVPKEEALIVQAAFADMEKDAPKNGEEYLQFWQDLSEAAIQFIETHQIATLPQYQTLRILPAPESAGPAARIGWVESAPPFAPNPLTSLYLPSIPDTFPEKERTEFWASFNKPFNRMIVIHELFPGHYMQIKISRESPHPIRLFFPYSLYIEGWATFTERVLLDAGWERENKLTLLAHLRKRLENANRAYTSVQVHCNGWDQEKVMAFSTETSLLAPQFAKSLWGRLMHSPMQMTSYFLGGQQFTDLFNTEKERHGTQFNLTDFMDTILRAGPIPIDEFSNLFKQ
ncbi:MAG: DUF885 family protein [Saprospiraceae bacterium]